MKQKNSPARPWYRMDNAGVLYSALQRDTYSACYRFSAVMTDPVNAAVLQKAIDAVMPRFPGFAVRIRRGLFWFYMEPNTAPGPFVQTDAADPCQPIRFAENDGWLVRFYAYEKRISLEVFHALSDGAGSMVFFRTLLAAYLRLLGHEIPNAEGILPLDEAPHPAEIEDAYTRYAGKKRMPRTHLPKAYQNLGTPEPFYTFHVTMGFMPLEQVKLAAKRHGASITEYLAAALIEVLIEKQKSEHPLRQKQVALAIPINLRQYFPSETLRNFILTARPFIDPELGDYTFEEIILQVRHYLRLHINRQEMQATITQNVRTQQNRLLGLFPVVLKNPVMAFYYRRFGTRPYSCTYTNPGAFTVPKEMEPHIHHIEVILGQATLPRTHCASISYGGTMEMTFAGTSAESDLEREFFRFLVRDGVPVKIESNRS